MLKEKPELILSQMGKNPVELAEKWLAAEVETMQMDPKERRIKKLEEEMKKVAEEKAAAKKAQEEAEKNGLIDKVVKANLLDEATAKDTPLSTLKVLAANIKEVQKAATIRPGQVQTNANVSAFKAPAVKKEA